DLFSPLFLVVDFLPRGVVFLSDTSTTETYTLSLHDALPISAGYRHRSDVRDRRDLSQAGAGADRRDRAWPHQNRRPRRTGGWTVDRKSTRLNSSHVKISYAVFCLKKKNTKSDISEKR